MPLSNMGLQFGLGESRTVILQKHRWFFYFTDVSANGIDLVPPAKSARPSVSFKEVEVQHVNETIYFPGKPEWKTIPLSIYEICNTQQRKSHPVMEWLKRLYDPKQGTYGFIIGEENFKLDASIEILDGCGNCVERWIYENCWPQNVEFQDLDMGTTEVLMAEMTLRYDRAYIVDCRPQGQSGDGPNGPAESTPEIPIPPNGFA